MTQPPVRAACLTLLLSALAAPVLAQAPAALPVGKTAQGRTSDEQPGRYRFAAPAAGVLTVAVHATSDVALAVTDEEGQTLPDGTADRDLFGDVGNEQITVTLPEGGTYHVEVRLLGGDPATFDIGAGWIAMPAFARPLDADRRPSMAVALEVGTSREDTLSGADDPWDWFAITPKTAGTLTVILRSTSADSPDLALELYTGGNFARPAVRSDDDLQGNMTNESGTVDVAAGQTVHVKVVGAVGTASGGYRIASSLIQ